MMNDIMDLHTHTIASGHAYNTLYEMARSAADHGISLLGVTEHGPKMPGSCHAFYFINFKVVPRELFGVKLMLGAELNILDTDGQVDLSERYLKRLDFAIASIHTPCYTHSTMAQNTQAYVNAMKHTVVRIIGHPDDDRFPVDYETLAGTAKENGVLLEINNSSLLAGTSRKGAYENDLKLLEQCRKLGTSVIINSDAHCEVDVGNHKQAQKLLQEIAFPEELIVNTSLTKAAAFLPCLAERIREGGGQ